MNTKRHRLSLENTLFLMTAPFIVIILVFSYLPLWGWAMAFVEYSPGVSILKSTFVGFKYFSELFSYTTEFPSAMLNTLAMSFLSIICSPLPVIFAILLTEIKIGRYKKIVQTATSLPNFISWVIVYSVAFSFFSVDDGLVNNLLTNLHLVQNPTNILGNNDITWYVQTAFSIWKTVGWTAIIYIGAIAGIEQELYEAAHVDGAGRFRQIIHITVPGVMPTYAVMLLLSIGWLLGGASFEQIYCFHNTLVHEKIQTLDYYAYSIGIKQFNFSLSTAIGVFKTVVSLVLLSISSLVSRKLVGRSII